MNVLIVAAHPDDEVLGVGGTVRRLANEGHTVRIVILGEGMTSRGPERNSADSSSIAALHGDAEQAGALMGAASVEVLSLPDNRFDSVPMLEVVKLIERQVEAFEPEWVFTQHGGDLNIDHTVTFRATLTATRPMKGCPVKRVYAYEVASSSEWAFQQFAPRFQPNCFFDISETLEVKIEAMQAYESEAREFPHPRSPKALQAQAVHWGSVVGVNAAEAFQAVRIIE